MREKIPQAAKCCTDDHELLNRLQNGDREAFTCIYERYHANLYTLAMRYLKDRAEVDDIIQQSFVKLWSIREALVVTSNLKGYLFAIVKHQVMNYIRNKNNALQHNYKIIQQQPSSDDDLYMYAERHYLTEQLTEAIGRLPTQQRAVARMRCEGYSNQEIAQKLNLSINTVNTHYRDCLKTLKTYFAQLVKILILYLIIR